MAKRRKVIHVASGKVFNTAAEAERAFGLPNSVLSEAIRLGKPCHGEVFKFCEDDTDVSSNDTKVDLSDVIKHRDVTDIDEIVTKYNGSPTDKYAASEYFNSIGYDTKVVSGVVEFYGTDISEVVKVVRDSGYVCSWGCSMKVNVVTEDENE